MNCAQKLSTNWLRFFLAGMLGVILFGVVTVHASSVSAAPLSATLAQQSVTWQIAAQLKRKPGGTQIAWNELSYDHGNILVQFSATSAHTETMVQPYIGYGGCPEGWVCVWHGINYSGTSVYVNGNYCGVNVDLLYDYGFIGIGSYSSTNGAAYPVDISDEWGNADFWILPGAQHHSPNTSSNSDAQYARYISECLG